MFFTGSFLLTWFLCAILVGIYASGRGRSGLLAFIWSILFSPVLVFIIYLIIGEGTTGYVRCPSCAEYIRREAVKCRYCNENLALNPQQKPVLPKRSKLWVVIILLLLAAWFAFEYVYKNSNITIITKTQTYQANVP